MTAADRTEADRTAADWLAVDWGSSALRVWVMGAGCTVLDRRRSDQGAGGLAPAGFETALLALIADILPPSGALPVICFGMAAVRQGWAEAPYRTAPCAPPGITGATRISAADGRLEVCLLPGVAQPAPPDVMRGEETQIAGFLAHSPDFDGVLCLPGSHSKWVRISAGEIVSFQTFLTGELFALLSRHSVLRHSVAAQGWDAKAFDTALADAMSRPQACAARLFALRAETLLEDLPKMRARARLSGLLIGLELAAARPYWLGQNVALIGAPQLCDIYRTALAAQGLAAAREDGDAMALAGLCAAWRDLAGAAR